ncbi:MAG: DUF2934 domain-containing protein [Planctomycetes bacterium]|nr:DUF2934 domain-containing protein [Planctomycetota bacterium]
MPPRPAASRNAPHRPSTTAGARRARRAAADAPTAVTPSAPAIDPRERQRMIAEAAYFLAERRGFAPGHELADWLAAERTVDERLRR